MMHIFIKAITFIAITYQLKMAFFDPWAKNKSIFVFCLGYLTEKLIPIAGPEK